MLTEAGVRRSAERVRIRRFEDARGEVWTVELKPPRIPPSQGGVPSSMLLFWTEDRACLSSVRLTRDLGELTVEELREYLERCLNR